VHCFVVFVVCVQLVLQYSAVDLMKCLWMVMVVSLLCPNSSPVNAFRALEFWCASLFDVCNVFFECATVSLLVVSHVCSVSR